MKRIDLCQKSEKYATVEQRKWKIKIFLEKLITSLQWMTHRSRNFTSRHKMLHLRWKTRLTMKSETIFKRNLTFSIKLRERKKSCRIWMSRAPTSETKILHYAIWIPLLDRSRSCLQCESSAWNLRDWMHCIVSHFNINFSRNHVSKLHFLFLGTLSYKTDSYKTPTHNVLLSEGRLNREKDLEHPPLTEISDVSPESQLHCVSSS